MWIIHISTDLSKSQLTYRSGGYDFFEGTVVRWGFLMNTCSSFECIVGEIFHVVKQNRFFYGRMLILGIGSDSESKGSFEEKLHPEFFFVLSSSTRACLTKGLSP